MKHCKALVSLLLVLAMMFALAACSVEGEATAKNDAPAATTDSTSTAAPAESTEAKSYKFGIIPQSMNDTFQITLANVAKTYLENLGHTATIMGGTTFADVNSQIEFIENMIANNYDAILCSPMEGSAGICTVFKQAIDAGIVVVNFDNSVSDAVLEEVGLDLTTFPRIGTNNYDASGVAANWLMEHYPEGTKVALICGTDGSECNNLRTNGFLDVCGDYIDLVTQLNADWEVEKGYTAAQNMITAHPEIEVFYAMSDNMAIGAANALADMGMTDVDIIGFDGTIDGLQSVIDGKFVCEIAQDPVTMAQTAAQLALDMLGGAKGQSQDTDIIVATSDNAQGIIDNLKPYVS